MLPTVDAELLQAALGSLLRTEREIVRSDRLEVMAKLVLLLPMEHERGTGTGKCS